MPAPVSIVTIHHQGGGPPTDNSSGYSGGGYTYGIGATRWERFRDVWSSYATAERNGVSVDVCLSGSRGNTDPAYPVTDADIDRIRGALADARSRGYVVDAPDVVAHRNSPGSSTACPGDNTMARWSEIVAACTAGAAPPASTSGGELLTTIASPQPGKPAGRTPTARPIPALGCVMLENGAALRGDKASGANRIWLSADPAVIATGNRLVDIAATVDGNGKPDGRGVVALFDLGDNQIGSYVLEWS
jgi:hypothetical protein